MCVRAVWRLLKGINPRWKYPLVRQYNKSDCGPAALLSALQMLGGNAEFAQVRRLCGTTSAGSTMHDLLVAAEALGLDARGATGEFEDLATEHMPCIAHVISETFHHHFLVLYRVRPTSVIVGDPARGIYTLTREEFLAIWRSKVVLLLRSRAPVQCSQPQAVFRWIFSYVRGNGPWLSQAVFLGLICTVLGLCAATSVQIVLDRLIPQRNLPALIPVAVVLALVVTLKACLAFFRQRFILIMGRSMAERLSSSFLDQLFHLPKEFFDSRRKGDITSRLGDAARVQQAFVRVLAALFLDAFVLTGSLLVLAFLTLPIFLCTLVMVPPFAYVISRNARAITEGNHETLGAYAHVESGYIDALNGIDEILNKHAGFTFAQDGARLFSRFQENLLGLGFLQARLSLVAELWSGLLSFGILSFGAYLVIDGRMQLGQMMAAFSLSTLAFPSVIRLVDAGIAFNGAAIAMQRLRDILQAEREVESGRRHLGSVVEIAIRDGEFAWNRRSRLFSGVSLLLTRGVTTALWGPSGSGKSTLADIILRKRPLQSGRLLVNNEPAEAFTLRAYRDRVGVVPQEPVLYHGTILQNIYLGHPAVDGTAVCRILGDIGLDHFLDRFEGGSGAVIGEDGIRLSWGERQVIALLRALVREPDVLILDEAFSGLDAGLEKRITDYLRRYVKDHAVMLITHDPEKLASADLVYILRGGSTLTALEPREALSLIFAAPVSEQYGDVLRQ